MLDYQAANIGIHSYHGGGKREIEKLWVSEICIFFFCFALPFDWNDIEYWEIDLFVFINSKCASDL